MDLFKISGCQASWLSQSVHLNTVFGHLDRKKQMKSPRILGRTLNRRILSLLVLSAFTVLSGCATTGSGGVNVTASDKTRMTKSGFLSDYAQLKQRMQHPLLLDGRNIYDPGYVKAQGFAYMGVGRS